MEYHDHTKFPFPIKITIQTINIGFSMLLHTVKLTSFILLISITTMLSSEQCIRNHVEDKHMDPDGAVFNIYWHDGEVFPSVKLTEPRLSSVDDKVFKIGQGSAKFLSYHTGPFGLLNPDLDDDLHIFDKMSGNIFARQNDDLIPEDTKS